MVELPPITLRLRGRKVVGRVAFSLLLLASIAVGGLAGLLFVCSSDLPQIRALLALQIERHYSKQQIFTMYCNQIYLSHGNYGFEAASEYYFGKPVGKLNVQEAALLAGLIRGPSYSPILHPQRALARRNLVLELMGHSGKITEAQSRQAIAQPLGLHLQAPRNILAPYFVEEIRKYLESTYGTEMVHQRGLRVYTTLNVTMQQAANRAIRDGLHAYDRRHGWQGKLDNILVDKTDTLDSYEDDEWGWAVHKGG